MCDLRIAKSAQPAKQTLQYGEAAIPYRIFFSAKPQAKIIIEVLPHGAVHVNAPQTATLDAVKRAVQKRARWIHHHISAIRQRHAHVLPRQYISGESHYYLGRRYVLKVIKVEKEPPQVRLLRGQFQVCTASRQPEIIKALLHDWYRTHAEIVFARRLASILPQVHWRKDLPPWNLRPMKKQWGSCSPKGTLSLNPQLVKAPGECVDYVILHELCHLKEHNHSKQFYRLLGQLLPEWQGIKAKLDGMSELLLVE